MRRLALLVSAALLLLATSGRGQDFDLSEALDPEPTKQPTPPTKQPPPGDEFHKPGPPVPRPKPGTHDDTGDDGFDLGDAVDRDEFHKPGPPVPQPKPGTHDDTGGISDADLYEGGVPPADPPADPGAGRASNPSAGGHGSGSSENTEGSQGMLAGIISSVVVAIAGAVSSFIAYQKKKLCFKQSDQENVNMESQQGAHAEPPVQRTLLQKS